MKARVDVIRPRLGGPHLDAAPPQRGQERERDQVLPLPERGAETMRPRAARGIIAPDVTVGAWRPIGILMTAETTTPDRPLRRGWTTGACATAAAKAAYVALLTGEFPDPVEITLPRGQRVAFALALTRRDAGGASAGVVKDAGDDPDVTHGALIVATRARRPRPAAALPSAPAPASVPSRAPACRLRRASRPSIRCRAG